MTWEKIYQNMPNRRLVISSRFGGHIYASVFLCISVVVSLRNSFLFFSLLERPVMIADVPPIRQSNASFQVEMFQ